MGLGVTDYLAGLGSIRGVVCSFPSSDTLFHPSQTRSVSGLYGRDEPVIDSHLLQDRRAAAMALGRRGPVNAAAVLTRPTAAVRVWPPLGLSFCGMMRACRACTLRIPVIAGQAQGRSGVVNCRKPFIKGGGRRESPYRP